MILKNILNYHKNRIKIINVLKGLKKRKAIGAFICDIGGRCISAVSRLFKVSWAYCKKCYMKYLNLIPKAKETRGRKKLSIHYPDLKSHIKEVIEEYACTDPDFKTKKRYVRLTLKEKCIS